jgi:hypothetical protein
MGADGDLVIYDAAGSPAWETGTSGHPGADLALESNGELVIYGGFTPLWTSGPANSELGPGEELEAGWYLDSMGGTCRLVMKRDGDLVLFAADGAVLWSSGTTSPGAFAVMESDGELAVYSRSRRLLWEGCSAGSPGALLLVAERASLLVELASGPVRWQPAT